MTQIRGFN